VIFTQPTAGILLAGDLKSSCQDQQWDQGLATGHHSYPPSDSPVPPPDANEKSGAES
jgi:hypothetical protein